LPLLAKLCKRFVDNPDYTRIVSRDHSLRLQSYTDDARAKGGRVVVLASDQERGTAESKVCPPTLIFSVTDEMLVMQEEIFGPATFTLRRRRFQRHGAVPRS